MSGPAPIVVHKYGGSSLATLDKVRAVAERIAATVQRGYRVVAVVSAMGKTTDGLLDKAKSLSSNPNPRELDMLVSTGERVSTALLAIALDELGQRAVSFTGSQSGIITNTRHNRARIVEVRPYRVHDELDDGKIVIVAGYQGVSYSREITTLGRGGTDTTAVALAAALGAEYCEICSDVDGVYTADPRVVPDAKRLDAVSHEEMIALARHGAKVLNQDCVEYASQQGVAIFAKSTFGARDDTGTVVRVNPASEAPAVTAIAQRRQLLEVELPAGSSPAQLMRTLTPLGALPSGLLGGGTRPLRVAIPTADAHRLEALESALKTEFGDAVTMRRDRGTVTAVGPGLGERPEVLTEAFAAATEVDASFETSLGPLALTFTVASEAVDDLVRALHAALITNAL